MGAQEEEPFVSWNAGQPTNGEHAQGSAAVVGLTSYLLCEEVAEEVCSKGGSECQRQGPSALHAAEPGEEVLDGAEAMVP